MQCGYSRSIPGLYRFLRKQGLIAVHPPNPKYVPKPYEQMDHLGQRIQIDVKFVPSVCLANEAKGNHFYQYTAIDEYSRWRFVEAFEEHSSHSSALFLNHLIKAFPRPIECVQTDNCQEFTKRFSSHGGSDKPTIFQLQLRKHGIKHKLIRSFTPPRHNPRRKEVIVRTMSIFMLLIVFILLMISVSSLNSATAGSTITSLCDPWDGVPPNRY